MSTSQNPKNKRQAKEIVFNEISEERIRELAEIARRKREEVQVELDRLKTLTEKELQYRVD